MWLYAAALVLEFAALVWLRVREPKMPRPYRIPGGLLNVILLSVPPVLLCIISMAMCPRHTQLLGAAGAVAGLIYYGVQFPSHD